MKKTIQSLLMLLVLFIGIKAYSQSFTLSDSIIEDSLYINGYFDESVKLQNNTTNKMVINYRIVENSIDTANWFILFCTYPECLTYIPEGGITDTIAANEEVLITNLAIEAGIIPKDCSLKIEFFDVSDSTFRDTLEFIFHASETDKKPVEGPGSVNDLDNAAQFSVYPNPISNQFNIEFKDAKYSWKLLDTYGRTIKKSSLYESKEFVEIDSSKLPSGMYMLEINTADGAAYQTRIIKP